MPARLFLEEFDTTKSAPERDLAPSEAADNATAMPAPSYSADDVERARLEGYETGYQAGWDDATRTDSAEQDRIGAEFARNLRDLGFTFHEARSHVMQSLEPLLTVMVERILPRLASETMGQTIVEELLPFAANAAESPIEVVVSPVNRPAIEGFLTEASSTPFTLVEEPTLADGQVYLRSGKTERHIDFTAAVDRIGTAINGLYELNEKAFHNG